MPTSDSTQTSILITGAGGFVGQHLVDGALTKGWTVWAGTRRTHLETPLDTPASETARRVVNHPRLHLIDLDYEHPERLCGQLAQLPRFQYVVHCAGLTRSVDLAAYERVNTVYTLHLAMALKEAGKTPSKFLFISSLEAIGPGDTAPFKPIAYDRPPHPVSAYGRSKWAAEEGLKSMDDLPWLILRPTGIYGPGDKDYLAMARLIQKGLAPTLGLKPQYLSFLYIEDLVELCWKVLDAPLVHRSWAAAHPEVTSDAAFIDLLQTLMEKPRVLRLRFPLWMAYGVALVGNLSGRISGRPALINTDKYRIIAARNWSCEVDALQEELGYTPPTDLWTGWEKTLAWYRHVGWL